MEDGFQKKDKLRVEVLRPTKYPGHAGNSESAKIEARNGDWQLYAKWSFGSLAGASS
jgi:hypothetical protein